jgi:hypothetical protein
MEERADGAFDKWKEEQFEEFWGQKQKIDLKASAGESSKIRLTTLVENNCVRVGDVWKFSRAFGKGPGRVLVEKEVKVRFRSQFVFLLGWFLTGAMQIIGSDGSSLTFAIPPGRRLVCCATDEEHTEMTESVAADPLEGPSDIHVLIQQAPSPSSDSGMIPSNGDTSGPGLDVADSIRDAPSTSGASSTNDAEPMITDTHVDGNMDITDLPASGKPAAADQPNPPPLPVKYDSDSDSALSYVDPSSQEFDFEDMIMPQPLAFTIPDARGRDEKQLPTDTVPQHTGGPSNESDGRMEIHVPQPLQEPKIEPAESATDGLNVKEEQGQSEGGVKEMVILTEAEQRTTKPTQQTPLPQTTTEEQKDTPLKDVILKNVVSPKTVEDKILRIDGRITNPSHGNAWQSFRCFRRNDDMGSLWDIRQHWYARQSQ